jgi:hypothetical protein
MLDFFFHQPHTPAFQLCTWKVLESSNYDS